MMTPIDGIRCPECTTIFWSRHRHDFRGCPCGYCFIDGGADYLRYGYKGDSLPQAVKIAFFSPFGRNR